MKNVAAPLLITLIFSFFLGTPIVCGEVDKDLTEQVSNILTECSKITVGTTRAELLKIFTTEGGISNAKHRTFVHRRCPYIKVSVEFALSDPKQKVLDERQSDTIRKISKPYLEWSIAD